MNIAISNDKGITINRLHDVTTVTVRDRNTGKVTSETFFGDSPFGKYGDARAIVLWSGDCGGLTQRTISPPIHFVVRTQLQAGEKLKGA